MNWPYIFNHLLLGIGGSVNFRMAMVGKAEYVKAKQTMAQGYSGIHWDIVYVSTLLGVDRGLHRKTNFYIQGANISQL